MSDEFIMAETIIKQLGGAIIFMMAFDRASTAFDNTSVTLKIAPSLIKQTGGRATHVKIVLDPCDTYTVQLVKHNKGTPPEGVIVEEASDIYCDQLRPLVEKMTGFALRL
jgi:hypothetical protein